MKFKIKHRKDGTFRCWTGSGREISGEYHIHPQHSHPSMLSLCAQVTDPHGHPKGVITNFDVTGYLDPAELHELVEKVGRRAETVERGEPEPPDVQRFDIRHTETWQRFLRNNPDFLRQNPQYLSDLRAAED
jgi:hypothetical protein